MLAPRSCTRIARSSTSQIVSKAHHAGCVAVCARPDAVGRPSQRRASSSQPPSSSLPPAWHTPQGFVPLTPYPTKDKVQIIVDSDFFDIDRLNPPILTKSLREFGHQYGRSVTVKMFRRPHDPHAIDLVNAGIEIRLYGSLVGSKDNLPNQILIADLWTFATDNPDALTIIFTKDRTYAIPLNTLSNRGHRVVVVSDLELADTELAAAGVFIDLKHFLARWPVHAFQRQSLKKLASKSSSASSSSASAKKMTKRPSGSTSFEGILAPSDDTVIAFLRLTDGLSKLARMSTDMQGHARPAKFPERVLNILFAMLEPAIQPQSGFPSPSVMIHYLCEIYSDRVTLPAPGAKPEPVKNALEVFDRIVRAFGVVPRVDALSLNRLRGFFFAECPSFTQEELNLAIKTAISTGRIKKDSDGAYSISQPHASAAVSKASSKAEATFAAISAASTTPAPPFPFLTSHPSASRSQQDKSTDTPDSALPPDMAAFFADVAPPVPSPSPTSVTSTRPSPSSAFASASRSQTAQASPTSAPSDDPEYLSLQLRGLQGYLDFLDTEPAAPAKKADTSEPSPSPSNKGVFNLWDILKQSSKPSVDAARPGASTPRSGSLYGDLASSVATRSSSSPSPADDGASSTQTESNSGSAPEPSSEAEVVQEEPEVVPDLPILIRKLPPAESSVKKKKGKLVWN